MDGFNSFGTVFYIDYFFWTQCLGRQYPAHNKDFHNNSKSPAKAEEKKYKNIYHKD